MRRRLGWFLGLLVSCGAVSPAAAEPQFGSPAWIQQKVQAPVSAPASVSRPDANAAYAGIGTVTTPEQAAVRTQESMRNLAETARRIAAAQAAQSAAAQIEGAGSFVPNGLAAGGLEIAPGAEIEGSPLWQFAELPVQTTENDRALVTVEQTDQNAILTWQSFNIGPQTTLHIDQSAGTDDNGNNGWIALNRIANPIAPSLIYGRLEAEGTVYLINNNGILFGAGSQVNTHSLLASSLALFDVDLGRANDAFLHQGLLGLPSGKPALAYPFPEFPPDAAGAILGPPPPLPGNIQVEAGATIHTGELGYSLLAGTHVSNAGTIIADDGQVLLAAALGLDVAPLAASGYGATQLQLESLYWLKYDAPLDDVESAADRPDATPLMTVSNTGVIRAERGNVTLLGSQVLQNGVVEVSTSLTRPGSISLVGTDGTIPLYLGSLEECVKGTCTPGVTFGVTARNHLRTVVLGEGSTTAVLPSLNGETTISTATADARFNPGGVTIAADAITLAGGALVAAPGAAFSATTFAPTPTVDTSGITGRIYIDRGAIVDVSGLADVRLPPGATLITLPRVGLNELADSPVQRDGALFRETGFVFDSTITGVRDDGTLWVGSPLLNVRGYVDAVERTIEPLLIDAGSITLTGSQIITAAGSTLRLDGGYLHYEGGATTGETRLLGADGRYYNLSQADPMATYLGVAGEHSVAHSRWNVTSVYADPLITGQRSSPAEGYIVGGNAGVLTISHTNKVLIQADLTGQVSSSIDNAILLAGDLSARAFAGRRQIEAASLPEGGSLLIAGNSVAGEAPFIITLGDEVVGLDRIVPGFGAVTPVDRTPYTTRVPLSAPALSAAGLSHVSITGSGIAVSGTQGLSVQPGGSIVLHSTGTGVAVADPRLVIAADLTAPGGSIRVTSSFVTQYVPDLVDPVFGIPIVLPYVPILGDIEVHATLSVRGRWVNDAGLPVDARGGAAFIDGGSIALVADAAACCTIPGFALQAFGDGSGSIVLFPGSVLDASGGGYVGPDGTLATSGGVPLGRGGDIALTTYATASGLGAMPAADFTLEPGRLELGGTLLGYGFGGGGTLSLRTLDIQIGGAGAADEEALHLAPEFFTTQGFAAYALSAAWDAAWNVAVPEDGTPNLTHLNLIPTDAIVFAPTGADLYDSRYTRIGQLDEYRRGPTHLTINAGDGVAAVARGHNVDGGVVVEQGAGILADPGSSIVLNGSTQVTVLGSIVSHGGSVILTQTARAANAASSSLWLGHDSLLDVSGTALIDPLSSPTRIGGSIVTPRSGRVLDGGEVVLSTNAFIVAERGAVIDLSGAREQLDVVGAGGPPVLGVAVASDAGSLTLASSGGVLFDATVSAHGGDASSRGGTLSLLAGPRDVILRQSGRRTLGGAGLVPDGLAPGDRIGALTAPINFAVDRLDDWGIESLAVQTPVLGFRGDVVIDLPGTVALTSGSYQAFPARPGQADSSVTIQAAYVRLGGPAPAAVNTAMAAAPATLTVNASQGLDLYGQFSLTNFGSASFNSGGDLRFLVPAAYGQVPGVLHSGGELAFSGARIYPASGTAFAVAAPGTVRFEPCGMSTCAPTSSVAPLSAGGSLRIDARQIVQNGVLYAPLGSLVLGVSNPADPATRTLFPMLNLVATESVTFGAGSHTSVSAGAEVVPFGRTVDDQSWQHAGATLAAPPSGQLLVHGNNITLAAGAVVDLSAGRSAEGLEYRRSGTTVTVAQAGHDLRPGELVYVRNATDINDAFVRVSATDTDGWTFEAPAALVDLGVNEKDGGLLYSRTGDTVTVAQRNHGLRLGDLVYVANAADGGINGLRKVTAENGDGWTFEIASVDTATGDLTQVLSSDLQALDWVPGLGGTRDVLSQYNRTYVNGQQVEVPLFPDERPIYAIIPGYQGLAPYDPAFDTWRVGAMVGQSVYLSGVGDLAAGYYTLLPAQYATLPGAYRVVQDTAAQDSMAQQNRVLPDGSYRVAGHFADGFILDPKGNPAHHDSRSTSFIVQSVPVWGQYSDYTLTSANAFFPVQAERSDSAMPVLPRDGARLVLGASGNLALGAQLVSTPGQFGAAASLDLASSRIQIVGSGAEARPGYLQIPVADLNDLGVGSLLIGGTRARTVAGDVLTGLASDVVLSNDAFSPLTGPEILLLATGNVELEDDAVIKAVGSLPASSSVPIIIGRDAEIRREEIFNATGSTLIDVNYYYVVPLITGDGALLRVSTAAPVPVTRFGVYGFEVDPTQNNGNNPNAQLREIPPPVGLLTLAPGSSVSGGAALTLNAVVNVQAPASAAFWADDVTISSDNVRFAADDDATGPGVLLGPDTIDRLRDARNLALYSVSGISFDRGLEVALGGTLTLSGGRLLAGEGAGDVTLRADRIVLDNTFGGAAPAQGERSGTLYIAVSELAFGSGTLAIDGFGTVDATADTRAIGRGDGSVDLGAADFRLRTPLLAAGGGTDTTLRTVGAFNLVPTGAAPPTFDEIGGTLRLAGGTLSIAATLAAPAGVLDLAATGEGGDLTIENGARLGAGGVALTFFDIERFAPGGAIRLSSAQGDVTVEQGAELVFAGATGRLDPATGGDAGQLILAAPAGQVTMHGTLLGAPGAPDRRGGRISVDTGGAFELDQLATAMADSGGVARLYDRIAVRTRAGDLVLPAGRQLVAERVVLIADAHDEDEHGPRPSDAGGHIVIDGLVDVSGPHGGRIELIGFSGVEVNGVLLANATDPVEGRGGDVFIATSGSGGGDYDGTYGYQSVTAARSGAITLGAGAQINVSSASADASLGGTIALRLPLLAGNAVNLAAESAAPFAGARDLSLEAYAVWSTGDDALITGNNRHFNGTIDPLTNWQLFGRITNSDPTCATQSAGCGYFDDPRTVEPEGTATAEGTLLLFVRGFELQGIPAIEGLRLRPGIELRSDGDITVASNWNLGAASLDCSPCWASDLSGVPSSIGGVGRESLVFVPPIPLASTAFLGFGVVREYAYRTVADEAPVLTLRAGEDVDIHASLSDGFVQLATPNGVPPPQPPCPNPCQVQFTPAIALQAPQAYDYAHARRLYDTLVETYPALGTGTYHDGTPYIAPPATFTSGDVRQIAQYYGLYTQYMEYLLWGRLPAADPGFRSSINEASRSAGALDVVAQARPLTAYENPAADPRAYPAYLYQHSLVPRVSVGLGAANISVPEAPPTTFVENPILGADIFTGAVYGRVDNGVSPASADLLYAALMGGMGSGCAGAQCTSTSMRIVAGSDFGSAAPLGLVASGVALAAGGDIRIRQTSLDPDPRSPPASPPPIVVRTGSGALELAAALDFEVLGNRAAAIYTAGVAAQGLRADTDVLRFLHADYRRTFSNIDDFQVHSTGTVHPVGAGDLRLQVQRHILGVVQPASSQYWWQWMQTGNAVDRSLGSVFASSLIPSDENLEPPATGFTWRWDSQGLRRGMVTHTTETSINFGHFVQDLLSNGGDIEIEAGGDIRNLSASLPTTWYLNSEDPRGWTVVGGGGTLGVHAGGDIIGGSYFVSRGAGRITADGRIGARPDVNNGVSVLLAVQDAQLEVDARQSVDVGGVYNPSYVLPRSMHPNFWTIEPLFQGVPNGAVRHSLFYVSRDSQPYSPRSAVSVSSFGGQLEFGTLSYYPSQELILDGDMACSGGSGCWWIPMPADILPSRLSLTALGGDLSINKSGQLYPSPQGNLDIVAGGSINFVNTVPASRATRSNLHSGIGWVDEPEPVEPGTRYFGMIDAPTVILPSPLLQHNAAFYKVPVELTLGNRYIGNDPLLHSQLPLHAAGGEPARIYALGDITGGLMPAGYSINHGLKLALNKPAHMRAGRDIVNLVFDGQHAWASDVTLISAGRDIRHDIDSFSQSLPIKLYSLVTSGQVSDVIPADDWLLVPRLGLAGPGTLVVEAARGVGPFIGQQQVATARSLGQTEAFRTNRWAVGAGVFESKTWEMVLGEVPLTGINTIGNSSNPHLQDHGADAIVLFGIGPGVAAAEFASTYLDPSAALVDGVRSFMPELVAFVRRYSLTADEINDDNAWARFLALPETTQRLLSYQVFFSILQTTAEDYNNPRSPHYQKYTRGYAAINALFPADTPWGYTRNALRGGANGASETDLVRTGDLDLRGTTLQTQQGGDISVFGPGGGALIGSTAASPLVLDAEGKVFAGLSTQGVLTLEEGDIRFFLDRSLQLGQSRMFTEQGGDILVWSSNGDVNAGRGARSSTEIVQPTYFCDDEHYCEEDRRGRVTGAGIATLQSIPGAPPGNVYLVAPRGTVDAGEGGIRVSGNLVVAAFAVANADNIQVQGLTLGVPSSKVDVGALSAGNAAAAAAQQQAAALARQAPPPGRAETLITVDVLGFGESDRRRRKR